MVVVVLVLVCVCVCVCVCEESDGIHVRLCSGGKSPAERLVDLVKQAEDTFEQRYGRGFPAGAANDDGDDDEDDDDLVV